MLTATYSLVAIAAEQDNARSMLSRLRQYIQATWKGIQSIDFTFLETAFSRLVRFDTYCRSRKLEVHLVPALREASREAAALIDELDALSSKGMGIIRSVREQLAAAFEVGAVKANEICEAIESYCSHLSIRLEREEKELIPLARRVLSIDDWFKIAARFLAADEGSQVQSRSPVSTRAFAHVDMR